MALRCSLLRSNLNIPTSHQLSDQVLMNRLKDGSGRGKYSLRVWTATRLQSWIAVGGILIGAAIFIGPLLWDEWSELLGYRYEPMDPSQMPRVSPDWWENEWRMMNPIWRAGESMPDFFVGPFRFVKEHTGRDLSSAEAFDHTRPTPHPSSNPNRRGWLPWARGSEGGASSANSTAKVEAPRVLVPLCGDSPIVGTMTLRGFEVDAVDSSRTAMLAAVERTERMLPGSDLYHLVHYHMTNFFEPELWKETIPEKSVDVIYERQGMTSINRDQRRDYAHLLKRALRDDGVMYVEGIFRTGRVKGNKVRGPPYSLSRRELEHLFPESEGYFVRCEEKTDAMRQLSRENRILQRVPRELYVTPFHCVVFKEHAVALDHRKKPPLSL